MTTPSSPRSVHSGLRWTSIGIAATRSSRLLANIVLARILAIEAFGLLAMANAAVLMVAALREAGLGHAYIQRKDREGEGPREASDTLFVLMLVLNGLLFLGLVLGAPVIAGFFKEDGPAVQPVLQALSVLFVLDIFVTTPQFMLMRRMDFRSIARSEMTASVTNGVVAISAGLAGMGVWSLVAGQLVARAALAVGLARQASWRPGFGASRRVASDLIHFGKYLWAYSLVRALGGVADKAVLGRYHGALVLGGYSQAFNLCSLPSNLIGQVVNRVALPALSRMQEDRQRLARAFLKSVDHVSFLSIPMGVGIFCVSDSLIPVLFGDRWQGIVPVVDVLAFYGTLLATASVCGPALQALGRPQIFLVTELIRQTVLLAGLLTFSSSGGVAVACCVLSALLVVSIFGFYLLARYLELRAVDLLGPMVRSSLAAALMGLTVWGAALLLPGDAPAWLRLLVLAPAGAASYPAFSLFVNRSALKAFLATVRKTGSRGA